MKKYFSKQEAEVIIDLLKSNDVENIKLALNLVKTHPKYKCFKKLITYRNYKGTSKFTGWKNNLERELEILNMYFTNIQFDYRSFELENKYLINFIKKRTKNG